MPVPDPVADAHERLLEAQRHGTELEQDDAGAILNDIEDRKRLVATEAFVLAVIGGYVPRSVWRHIARKLRVVAVAEKALATSRATDETLTRALDELAGLRALVKQLERQVANLTPGVCEPK